MTVTFRLRFSTQPGQSLWLAGNHPLPGHPVPLQYVDPECWQVTLPLSPQAAGATLSYSYVLRGADGAQTTDWGRNRALVPASFGGTELLVLDAWNHAGFVENVFYTEPFKKVLFAENFTSVEPRAPKNPTHTFRVKAPLLAKNQTLCLLGEGAALGHWNTSSPVLLGRQPDADDFSGQLDLRGQAFPLAYKYGVYEVAKNPSSALKTARTGCCGTPARADKHTVVNDGFIVQPASQWRGAGVAVPVFSLRSEKSFGVGEFADLKPLADWGKKTGLKLIQLLPVNDTSATHTWKDSYPYAAISAFALHPLYLNLAAAANPKNKKLLKALEPERQRLNALDAVDYEAVMRAKLDFLKKIFPSQKSATFRAKAYQEFFAENEHWLAPYAAFCFLRDKFGTADFNRWPEHQTFDAQKIAALVKGNDEIAFHYFIQFHLHCQLQDAAAHIHAAGLVLKGDIAIGVFRHGADAWQSPELFTWTCRPARRLIRSQPKARTGAFQPTTGRAWPPTASRGGNGGSRRWAIISTRSALTTSSVFFASGAFPRTRSKASSAISCRQFRLNLRSLPRAGFPLSASDSPSHSSTKPCCGKFSATRRNLSGGNF